MTQIVKHTAAEKQAILRAWTKLAELCDAAGPGRPDQLRMVERLATDKGRSRYATQALVAGKVAFGMRSAYDELGHTVVGLAMLQPAMALAFLLGRRLVIELPGTARWAAFLRMATLADACHEDAMRRVFPNLESRNPA